MAPQGKFNRTNISKSDVTVATVLPTYYCICGEYILVGNVNLDLLAQRPLDGAFVLRNHASEEYGPKHVYKLNSENEKEAVYISRKSPEGKQVGFEKIWRRRCPRCELVVGYETTDPRDKRPAPYSFLLKGALTAEQSAIPADAFGDEASPA